MQAGGLRTSVSRCLMCVRAWEGKLCGETVRGGRQSVRTGGSGVLCWRFHRLTQILLTRRAALLTGHPKKPSRSPWLCPPIVRYMIMHMQILGSIKGTWERSHGCAFCALFLKYYPQNCCGYVQQNTSFQTLWTLPSPGAQWPGSGVMVSSLSCC